MYKFSVDVNIQLKIGIFPPYFVHSMFNIFHIIYSNVNLFFFFKEGFCMGRDHKCVCDQLERLQPGTQVDIFLNGNVLEDLIFTNFNLDTFCATFVDVETETGTIIVLDCRDIQALRIE